MAKAKAMDTVHTAVNYVQSSNPPAYSDMDCQAFIEASVNENGSPKINYRGSNDMFRNALVWSGTLSEAKSKDYLKPGVWLFIVEHNGNEPEKYKADGIGNASHVGIYTDYNGIQVAHSSSSRGGVFASTLKNGWTHVGVPKDVLFDWNQGGDTTMEQNQINQPNPAKTYPVLRKGKKGYPKETAYLQQLLISLGYSVGKSGADGIFGSGTHNALWQFQKEYSLGVDGIAGKETWAKLETLANGGSSSNSNNGSAEEKEKGNSPHLALDSEGEDIGSMANLHILDMPREKLINLRGQMEVQGFRTEISYG